MFNQSKGQVMGKALKAGLIVASLPTLAALAFVGLCIAVVAFTEDPQHDVYDEFNGVQG
jgi:hypothetical protein